MQSMLLLGFLLVGVVYGQVQDLDLRRLCNAQVSCGDCIFSDPSCIWCADLNYNGTRCYPFGDPDFQNQCPGMEQNPTGGIRDTVAPRLEGLTQVSPSRVTVSVRPGRPESFNLNVRPARNFPIDLYLLMDLSYSMRDDLDNLKLLGANLAASIVGLSTNFTIGFGSFVEKVVAPFTTLDVRFQQNPCLNSGMECEPTYSYRHVISLTNDSTRFNDLVQAQMISGNQDLPEGGFDGFLQSLLCTNLIGWRDVSRKLLLYITDAGFHLAGDGKLGGLVLPHQSFCRLPNTGLHTGTDPVEYMDAELYDYPSVGQIAQALREQDIIPIFAAERDARDFYDALAAEIGEGASTGVLESDSSNVVELVEQQYNTISQRVIFDQEPVPGVSITVTPTSCPEGIIEFGICSGLQIERQAEFDVTVSISECTPQLSLQNEINIPLRVVGFGVTNIILNPLCSCECENTQSANDSSCSGNGTLSCGQCECNPNSFGQFCQCDATSLNAQLDCPTGDNELQCSGRGTCLCGVCDCEPGFFGQACECDERLCVNQDSGLLCSGRGSCGCDGRCTCNVEPVSQLQYNGPLEQCECTPNTQKCRDPATATAICNGRGMCGCGGTCECESPYFGQFCELCSGSDVCFDTNCDSNRDCANCALDIIVQTVDTTSVMAFFANAPDNLPAGSSNSSLDPENNAMQVTLPDGHCPACASGAVIIDGTERADYLIDGELAVRCEEIRDGCIYRYFVAIDATTDEFTAVHVEYTRSCPDQQAGTAPWIIAISIIIPLLVLGVLLLLILKGLLLLVDYIEVQKFEKELRNIKYSKNENPLFRSATREYQNPMYGQ